MDETRAQGPRSLSRLGRPRRAGAMAITVGMLLFAACLSGTAPSGPAATQVPTAAKVDEFFIVDCLLPGQIRQLGREVVYVTRGTAIKTSARDCQIRGGEYVAFDRSNYATSLKVWLPLAEQGEPGAQTYVGEIFEKGLGVRPDYAAAAVWYRRAAEKGYSRAAINLGNLYEQGLGVPKNNALALNWYRRAAGLSELSFGTVSQSQAAETQRLRDEVAGLRRELKEKQEELNRTQRELQNLRRSLEQRRSEADSERLAVTRLRRELEERRKKEQTVTAEFRKLELSIADREARLATKDRDVANLRASLARLETESNAQRAEIARLQKRTIDTAPNIPDDVGRGVKVGYPLPTKAMSFGNYHALVIGNDDYRLMPRLKTAVNDAKEVARLLREQYGFKVTLLLNANRYETVSALDTLRERLTDEDNLLLFYAGHGELDRRNQRGHWLPVDAERNSQALWISNVTITDILNTMTVKQLLVVADSCYSGTLTRSALGRLDPGKSKEEALKLMQVMARQRSRMVMTSGGVEPVIDTVGGQHSVFAQPFIDLLQANVGVLPGQELFYLLQHRVATAAQEHDARQVPEYAPIKLAGHESGDFFFVRASN